MFIYALWKIFQRHQDNAKQEKQNELRKVLKQKVRASLLSKNVHDANIITQMSSSNVRVILHHFGPGKHTPDPSPFPVKLETWLRVNNIKYIKDQEFVSIHTEYKSVSNIFDLY